MKAGFALALNASMEQLSKPLQTELTGQYFGLRSQGQQWHSTFLSSALRKLTDELQNTHWQAMCGPQEAADPVSHTVVVKTAVEDCAELCDCRFLTAAFHGRLRYTAFQNH